MTIVFCAVTSKDLYESRHDLIQLYADRGFQVVLLSPEYFDCKNLFRGNVVLRLFPMGRTGLSPLTDAKTYNEIKKIFQEIQPEIVFSFSGAKAVIYATLASKSIKNCKAFCMVNGLGSIYRIENEKNRVIRVIMNFLYKRALGNAVKVFFQNKDDKNEFLRIKNVKKEQCEIVNGSGVNLDTFCQSEIPAEPVCLFVGRLLIDKGIHEFVEAARMVKQKRNDARFIVVGPYDTNPMAIKENEMKNWIREGIIEYWGKRDDMFDVYRQCRLFILPSYHEGTPRTVLEAMAVGRPIVTTDAPGCRETIIDGYNGFMIPIKDSKAIADSVLKLLESNELVHTMAANSRKMAEEKYDVRLVNKQIEKIIDAQI